MSGIEEKFPKDTHRAAIQPGKTGDFNLRELRSKQTWREAKDYLTSRFGSDTALGVGSDRIVWKISIYGFPAVLKMARHDGRRSSAQNKQEVQSSKKVHGSPYFTKVLAYDEQHFWWVISELARPLRGLAEFEKITGMPYNDYWNLITAVPKSILWSTIEKEEYDDNEWLVGFLKAAEKYNVNLRDAHLGNLGAAPTRNGKEVVVLVDYGWSDAVGKIFENSATRDPVDTAEHIIRTFHWTALKDALQAAKDNDSKIFDDAMERIMDDAVNSLDDIHWDIKTYEEVKVSLTRLLVRLAGKP